MRLMVRLHPLRPLRPLLPLSAREVELIFACLDDGSYTKQEQSDFAKMGKQALRAIELEAELATMKGKQ